MAYLSREFHWHLDDETGMEGWIPSHMKGIAAFLPSESGRLICHDLLEHFKLDGSIEDEMMALGQMWYIRVDSGRVTSNGYCHYSMSYRLGTSMQQAYGDDDYGSIPVIRQPANRDERLEDLLNQRADVEKHFWNYLESDQREELADNPEFRLQASAWFTDAFHWVLRGYLKSIRRWGQKGVHYADGSQHAAQLFWDIASDIDKRHRSPDDGDVMHIHVGLKNRTYNIVRSMSD